MIVAMVVMMMTLMMMMIHDGSTHRLRYRFVCPGEKDPIGAMPTEGRASYILMLDLHRL